MMLAKSHRVLRNVYDDNITSEPAPPLTTRCFQIGEVCQKVQLLSVAPPDVHLLTLCVDTTRSQETTEAKVRWSDASW